ncbi:exosome complex component RRP45-like isoform X2 [Rhopilema esculentum]|uniref:exosome complex component RRP45-like isoform X2 n=1 Tax=Rhopilema esculentum TaxID=499914 RepID=UPI0031D9A51D
MKAADPVRSTCERDFVVSALQREVRQDGRKFHDYRQLKIAFGESFGHCEVCIGRTRALAQVSCEVVEPNESRPKEGLLFVNIDLSPMASPAFETGRPSNEAIDLNRFAERCLKESKAIDTESLCIIAGEKVWCIRVDIQVLDDTGNILDCACLSAIAALRHFRLPVVTIMGKDIEIHSFDDKEPVPLGVYHMPICITLGFLEFSEKPLLDPTELEEFVLDGKMMIAMNSYMEICCAKMCGVSIDPEKVIMCCRIASSKVKEITAKIKKSLENDNEKRFPKKESVKVHRVGDNDEKNILKTVAEPSKIDLTEVVKAASENVHMKPTTPIDPSKISIQRSKIATVGNGGTNAWVISDDDSEDMEVVSKRREEKSSDSVETITIDDDSEEEETVQLTVNDLDYQNSPMQIKAENNTPSIPIESDSTKTVAENSNNLLKRKKKKKRKNAKSISS